MEKFVLKMRGEDGHRMLSVRLPERIVVQIEQYSAKVDISRNRLIGLLLAYALENTIISDNPDPK